MHTAETRKRAYDKTRARRASWLLANGPCRCGSWNKLEVHHIDPEQKTDHNVWSWSEDRRLKELAKCITLCYECHKKESSNRCRMLFKQDIKHGTVSAYNNHGCRCDICKDSRSIWRKERYIKTGT